MGKQALLHSMGFLYVYTIINEGLDKDWVREPIHSKIRDMVEFSVMC